MAKSSSDVSTCDMLPDVVITKRPNGTLRVDHMNYEKSMTQQCFSEAADINRIMTRWLNGGPPPVSDASRAVFKDVSHGLDYREILDRVMEVQESFDSLPAELRSRFANDPANLLDFVGNPANFDEATKLGLLESDSDSIIGGVNVPPEQLPLDVTVRTDSALDS